MRYSILRWALIPAIALHNFEEWLTFPYFRQSYEEMIERIGLGIQPPSWAVTQLALVIATIIPVFGIALAARGQRSRIKDFFICFIAAVFLANAFLPHIPAVIVMGGYAPGVITAVLINLPLCAWLLHSAVRERILSVQQAAACVVLGAVSVAPSIVAIMFVSGQLTRFL
jgi:hypothetical protein